MIGLYLSSTDHHDGLPGDLCEAGWDATEQEHEFDQLTEDDLRW